MKITHKTTVTELKIVEGKRVAVIKIPDPAYPTLNNCDSLHIPGEGLTLDEKFTVTITNE